MTGPKVLVYACNWDGLSCVEAAAHSRFCYPASVQVVRITCLARLNAGSILSAFVAGAEGVILLGCQPGQCHYGSEPSRIRGEYETARQILEMLGIGSERLMLAQTGRGNAADFMNSVTEMLKVLGAPVGQPAAPSRPQIESRLPLFWQLRTEG